QVTTIEDTIAGSLTLTQVALLVIAVLIVAVITAGLPPALQIRPYKIVLSLGCGLPCVLLAGRWRGQLLLTWIRMKLSYHSRPHIYLLSEYDASHCRCLHEAPQERPNPVNLSGKHHEALPMLEPNEQLELNRVIGATGRLRFVSNAKGEINVVLE
ncbi:MAG: hypothetical protein M1356_02065, partial [Gammaproteobacteria bacterium]|nr:hypothetical protein [Gammaproteobacteria bacterium]